MSSRRVSGRLWFSCRCGASGWRSLRLTLMSMVVTSNAKRESLNQHRGAADDGRADSLGDVLRSIRVVVLAGGESIEQAGACRIARMTVNQLAELRASRSLVGLMRELDDAKRAIQERIEQRVLVGERGCRCNVEDEARERRSAQRRILHERVAVLDRERGDRGLMRRNVCVDCRDSRQRLADLVDRGTYAGVVLAHARK